MATDTHTFPDSGDRPSPAYGAIFVRRDTLLCITIFEEPFATYTCMYNARHQAISRTIDTICKSNPGTCPKQPKSMEVMLCTYQVSGQMLAT
jgi:hypothetical protein